MLLKIIKSPKVFLDLSESSTEEAMSQVKSLREEFFNGNGKDVFPPVKIEEYHELQPHTESYTLMLKRDRWVVTMVIVNYQATA